MIKNLEIPTERWVKTAYKKLKNYLYFDKTQLPVVDDLVVFESHGIEKKLSDIAHALDADDDVWEDFTADIVEKTAAFVYPKRLCSCKEEQIIFNADSEPVRMEAAKYFIDLPIAGHILGTLWVLTIGACLDGQDEDNSLMYDHSYGNRLRRNLYNPKSGTVTYSPYLFEPYFSQYESWRNTALTYAKERLNHHQDALILTLDFRNFFYSVHLSEADFSHIYQLFQQTEVSHPAWAIRIHNFVYQVLQKYSEVVRQLNTDPELALGKRTFLPIGFLPSNILSNWVLTFFDRAINERVNPVYYGRYVDDIILVDKVEKNNPLYTKARSTYESKNQLTVDNIIEYYFGPCSEQVNRFDGLKSHVFCAVPEGELTPRQRESLRLQRQTNNPQSQPFTVYRVDPSVFKIHNGVEIDADVQIQNDKVKVFYFKEGSTRALLDCFRAEIGRNASEFRYLPDVDHILGNNDYSEIFKLVNKETPHKLRGVASVSLDKFSLSKFLGKYRKVGNLIRDKQENAFDRDLLTILNHRSLIENYLLWERILEILIVNDRLDYYERLVKNIIDAIAEYEVPDSLVKMREFTHRRGLYLTLRTAIFRTSALCWGKKMNQALSSIQTAALQDDVSSFTQHDWDERRMFYCHCRMVNKYVLPLPIGWLKREVFEEEYKTINLCHLEEFRAHANWDAAENRYVYFPYMVTPHEIAYALACKNIAKGEKLDDPQKQIEKIRRLYYMWNYGETYNSSSLPSGPVNAKPIGNNLAKGNFAIHVDSSASAAIKVAVGNARLYRRDFERVLTGNPNRSYKRYQQVAKLLKEALVEEADLLVLPENFLPWEWLPDISRLCAANQMALVTGIEHVISEQNGDETRKVYNLTAVILPYREGDHKFAHIVYHHKVHYSPEEIRAIRGYRMNPFHGEKYQLFHWKDLWFSVYCCFELAAIKDRSLFQSLTDLTVAVEWNRDIPYFSSIMESLCRDLHCYCIQVNSSDYGDSRVMVPAKTERRDLIKTKGGQNHTILVDQINLNSLREYQRKEYELQREDSDFKPTPPHFDPSAPERKQNGTLWEYLTGEQE